MCGAGLVDPPGISLGGAISSRLRLSDQTRRSIGLSRVYVFVAGKRVVLASVYQPSTLSAGGSTESSMANCKAWRAQNRDITQPMRTRPGEHQSQSEVRRLSPVRRRVYWTAPWPDLFSALHRRCRRRGCAGDVLPALFDGGGHGAVTAGLFRAGASSFCVSNQSRIWRPPLPRP
jgi:hypothetical protein